LGSLEWENRLEESKMIAKENKNKILDLIFNTSLFSYIENYNNI